MALTIGFPVSIFQMWDCRGVPSFPVYMELGIELKALWMLSWAATPGLWMLICQLGCNPRLTRGLVTSFFALTIAFLSFHAIQQTQSPNLVPMSPPYWKWMLFFLFTTFEGMSKVELTQSMCFSAISPCRCLSITSLYNHTGIHAPRLW